MQTGRSSTVCAQTKHTVATLERENALQLAPKTGSTQSKHAACQSTPPAGDARALTGGGLGGVCGTAGIMMRNDDSFNSVKDKVEDGKRSSNSAKDNGTVHKESSNSVKDKVEGGALQEEEGREEKGVSLSAGEDDFLNNVSGNNELFCQVAEEMERWERAAQLQESPPPPPPLPPATAAATVATSLVSLVQAACDPPMCAKGPPNCINNTGISLPPPPPPPQLTPPPGSAKATPPRFPSLVAHVTPTTLLPPASTTPQQPQQQWGLNTQGFHRAATKEAPAKSKSNRPWRRLRSPTASWFSPASSPGSSTSSSSTRCLGVGNRVAGDKNLLHGFSAMKSNVAAMACFQAPLQPPPPVSLCHTPTTKTSTANTVAIKAIPPPPVPLCHTSTTKTSTVVPANTVAIKAIPPPPVPLCHTSTTKTSTVVPTNTVAIEGTSLEHGSIIEGESSCQSSCPHAVDPVTIEETPPERGRVKCEGVSSSFSCQSSCPVVTTPSKCDFKSRRVRSVGESGFKTPNISRWLNSKHRRNLSHSTSGSLSPSSSSSTSSFSSPAAGSPSFAVVSSGGKITPPLCGCGKRAKRKFVSSPGPNEGLPFYVCPNGRGTTTTATGKSRQSCNFFKWERQCSTSRRSAELDQSPLLSDYGEYRYK